MFGLVTLVVRLWRLREPPAGIWKDPKKLGAVPLSDVVFSL